MPIHTIAGGGRLQLAVHEYGQPHGKPILLIHGFSQCHLVWSKQFQSSLADEFRLVCPDNRGHGMSEKPTTSEHYTQGELWAEDVHAIITGLALHKPILAGWSYGGFIINDYLAQYRQDTVGGINYVCGAVLLGVEKAANMFGSAFTDRVPGLCSENLEENIRAVRLLLRAVFEKQPTQDEFEGVVAFNMCRATRGPPRAPVTGHRSRCHHGGSYCSRAGHPGRKGRAGAGLPHRTPTVVYSACPGLGLCGHWSRPSI